MTSYSTGQIIWVDFNPTLGREQQGDRPAIIVSTPNALSSIPELVTVCPLTTTYRNWPTRLPIHYNDHSSWIIAEQIRTISIKRVRRATDHITSTETLQQLARIHQLLYINHSP